MHVLQPVRSVQRPFVSYRLTLIGPLSLVSPATAGPTTGGEVLGKEDRRWLAWLRAVRLRQQHRRRRLALVQCQLCRRTALYCHRQLSRSRALQPVRRLQQPCVRLMQTPPPDVCLGLVRLGPPAELVANRERRLRFSV